MATLRLTPSQPAPGAQEVTLELRDGSGPPLYSSAALQFALNPEQRESLRWYLEDYLRYPQGTDIYAARVHWLIAEWGAELFQAVFSGTGGQSMWATIRDRLGDLRVELAVDPGHIEIPWELMRETREQQPLALRARSFVYVPAGPVPGPASVPPPSVAPLRLLLCVARPKGGADISFRSVALRLLHSLSDPAGAGTRVELIRPATFERFQRQLQQARTAGAPYELVHFDGHGVFDDLSGGRKPGGPPGRERGYLVFEDGHGGEEYVDATTLGRVLVDAGVRVLVLNACRSARAAQAEPGPVPADDRARAFGSLAAELAGAGIEGVVAMRYNLYLATAVRFVHILYRELIAGQPLGESVAAARAELAQDPHREVGIEAYELSDWFVPVVIEPRPLTVTAPARYSRQPAPTAQLGAPSAGLDPWLPERPAIGFIGRDEPLLELDRALQSHRIVILHGPDGSGKTATVAELARWLHDTGGADGPVSLISLRRCRSVNQLIEETAGQALVAGGAEWNGLPRAGRLEMVRQRLAGSSGLWILDDADAPDGDPAHELPPWSDEERSALLSLVRELANAGLRFVLTARRAGGAVADLATARVRLWPLPMQDRVQFARALAERAGVPSLDPPDWAPILHLSDGNPAQLEELVSQVLATGPPIGEAVAAVAAASRVRPGAEAAEGADTGPSHRNPLLAAFRALPDADRRKMVLLHLFRGAVDSLHFWWMGHPDNPAALPELADLSQEEASALLDRGADAGLLESLGGRSYIPHPALAKLLAANFAQLYPGEPPAYNRALNAYGEGVGQFAVVLDQQAKEDSRNPELILGLHSDNLRHAREIALAYLGQEAGDPHRASWLSILVGSMQGLHRLYGGDVREWMPLVDGALRAISADPAGHTPGPGAEYAWSIVAGYRIRRLRESGRLEDALALQKPILEYDSARVAPFLQKQAEDLSREEHQAVSDYSSSLHERAQLLRASGDPACRDLYDTSMAISARMGDQQSVSTCAFNLGLAHLTIDAIKDLSAAERWFTFSLEKCPPGDLIGQAMCLAQLGLVERERQHEALQRGDTVAADIHLRRAFALATRALRLTPADAASFGMRHQHLADLWVDAGRLEEAVKSYREAISAYDRFGENTPNAAGSFLKLARALFQAGRYMEARDYAGEALIRYHFAGLEAGEKEARALFRELDVKIRPDAQQ